MRARCWISTRPNSQLDLRRGTYTRWVEVPTGSIAKRCMALGSTCKNGWAEARIKIARMTLTIKLDGNWSCFQLANSAPPLSVTDSAIAPSARMLSSSSLPSTPPSKYDLGRSSPLCFLIRERWRRRWEPKKDTDMKMKEHAI